MTDGVSSMDAARRAALKARCEAATPGEWTCQPDADPPWWYVEDAQERLVGDWMEPADAAFIAAARADVPDLLAALDAAEAENARLRAALAKSAVQPAAYHDGTVCVLCHAFNKERGPIEHRAGCLLAAAFGDAAPAGEE